MYKVKVNNKETFELNAELSQVLTTAEHASISKKDNASYQVQVGSESVVAHLSSFDPESKKAIVKINQVDFEVLVQEPADILLENLGMQVAKPKHANQLASPMPGLILQILVQPNQAVKKGDSLIILEAMKMENVFKANADCVIASIEVQEKQAVEKGQVLIKFQQ